MRHLPFRCGVVALVLWGSACSSPPPSCGAVAVTVELARASKVTCVRVMVQGATGTESRTDPLLRGDKTTLTVAIYPSPQLGPEVTLQARGYEGTGCAEPLVLTEQSEPTTVAFAPGEARRVRLRLWNASLVDQDQDGHGAADAGGDDCDDQNPLVSPSQAERCDDSIDDDCDALVDCHDPGCTAQACDDKLACTSGEMCLPGGGCAGALDCNNPPECHLGAGTCGQAGACAYPRAPVGAPCGTDRLCRNDGVCVEAGTELDCADGKDDPNDADSLADCDDPDCQLAGCNDGLRCTVADRCVALGTCRGVDQVCNRPPGQCWSDAGTCDPGTGQCHYTLEGGRSCNDQDLCTDADLCGSDGGCAGTPKRCTAPPANGCFGAATCDPATGQCKADLNSGAVCDDNTSCSFGDRCQADGGCVGTPYACAAPTPCHLQGSCLGDGGCGFVPATGSPCATGYCRSDFSCGPLPFPYTPTNFDPNAAAQGAGPLPRVVIDCAAQVDTSGAGAVVTWCPSQPQPAFKVLAQPGGPDVLVLPLLSLEVRDGGSLRFFGDRPAVVAVYGHAAVGGALRADALFNRSGPGGDGFACEARRGTDGQLGAGGGSGGAGAGFATRGGPGGTGAVAGPTDGGSDGGLPSLSPLLGGCRGGRGGSLTGADGGGGGGGLQLSVAGTLDLFGVVSVSGGGGLGGVPPNGGAGGGGSGGAVLLEASTLSVKSSGRVTANGGSGGEGADNNSPGFTGEDGALTTDLPSAGGRGGSSGVNGGGSGGAGSTPPTGGFGNGNSGGGGGGGAVGRIRLRASTCGVAAGAVVSPPAEQGCP